MKKQTESNPYKYINKYISLLSEKRELRKRDSYMIANKVYTREEMREERIHTADYRFIDKAGEYTATLVLRAEASSGMLRLFFRLSDGRKCCGQAFL